MSLFIRLVRALFLFGVIFADYMIQLGLGKLFRTYEKDSEGREVEVDPDWLVRRRTRVDARNAKRLLHGMLSLRGVYIKLGQVLSVMGGFLPEVYGKELEQLQDSVPPHSFDEIEQAFIEGLGGRKPSDCYREMDREPLAAASLGQVHVAYLKDGTKVAVKVLYPGIRDVIRVDMKVIALVLRVYMKFVPMQNLESVHGALVDLLRRETDYEHEAACMERMAKQFEDEDDILFPATFHEFSSKDVLTMTFMEGFKITNFDEYEKHGIDRTEVATRVTTCGYKQLFVHRFFHADPHPGNFLVQPSPDGGSPKLVILDFGAISEVEAHMVEGMLDILRGLFEADDTLVLGGIETMGFVAPGADRSLLEKTVKTYFQKLLRIGDKTAGALMRANEKDLRELVDPEVARRELRGLMKSIRYPDGWFYSERAAVMLFWLVGRIDPELDTFAVGFPYVMPIFMERVAAKAAEAERAAEAGEGDVATAGIAPVPA